MSKLADHYVERIHFDHSYAIKSIDCKHCDFSVEPIRSMGNFGRVSNMRKRMRDHIKGAHPELVHPGKGG